ncbi:MAG: hypothetical protein IJF07_09020 [Lachnospiraceae bacterium]|nr:hypothetical protein [Lachnospiraceae bacterium]
MATYYMKCDCGEIVAVHVGDKICSEVLCWFWSYHRTNCGKAVELDGLDSIPSEIKKAILEQEGTYELYLCNTKDTKQSRVSVEKEVV